MVEKAGQRSLGRVVSGYVLLGICALAWLAVVVVPFLGFGLGKGAAIITGLIVVGEAAFLLGVLLLGKDIIRKTKQLIVKLKEELK